ncbi:Imm1 family immunity protein [Lentzea sp. BCCO 10_0856]|uniref:Imm1 family immunity protein n=1 Tax=Lentzea miocenica TaxID=3095431 RepID=A0ABU4TH96_9PSEU|nr:Imm1 family immunity protein [Lentzea sp. BCCO 10_0856]MDX8037564.1 Imm1 family immunity protein [Lentzea sp. BCCO 10_0856]
MSYTLDVWYYRDDLDRPANEPVAVTSSSELKELLEYLLAHVQPHPPQIVARERPRVGPYDEPDTLIKIAVAIPERLGALLFLSPLSWEQPVDGDTATGVYATRGELSGSGLPTLYIDQDTKTPFPADAGLPIDRIFAALEEFRQTGERPTCVDWQESQVS